MRADTDMGRTHLLCQLFEAIETQLLLLQLVPLLLLDSTPLHALQARTRQRQRVSMHTPSRVEVGTGPLSPTHDGTQARTQGRNGTWN
jgi:hypothetical protein